ncbi:hypothetical protein [Robiginitomaculum antarcticum]|uniref:hypothetical protein n=1 Tax=Robiginitomaculum antarcticum TaxID=437507 RepID=UPI00047732DF|nr:hypothetical protein [Robiginitomaculum antarcticum]
MAFTDTEITEIHEAVTMQATHQDLFKLGLMYSTEIEDRGPDFVEAHKWFSLAAMMGSEPALAYRADVTEMMSRQDLTLAQRAARGWLAEQKTVISRCAA